MKGVQFVVDSSGRKTAVQIDLKKQARLWEALSEPNNAHPRGRGTKEGPVSGRNRLLQNGTPAPSGAPEIPRLARGTACACSTRMIYATVDFLHLGREGAPTANQW